MPRRHSPDNETSSHDDRPSKTQVKQAMLDLQQLGQDLLELPVDRLDAIGMDNRLREAVEELRRITAHGARKRQMQYVGKLLRSEDPEPFRRALETYRAGRLSDARAQHEVERWRDRLLTDTAAIDQWVRTYPQADTPQFRRLVELARGEVAQMAGTEGARRTGGRNFRELFRQLRGILSSASLTDETP